MNTKPASSYDILDKEKTQSYEIIDSDDDHILDESVPNTLVPTNSPADRNIEYSYYYKQAEIKKLITFYKQNKHDTKSRREIRALERQAEKLTEAENKQIPFPQFSETVKSNLKNAKGVKGVNDSIKQLWQ